MSSECLKELEKNTNYKDLEQQYISNGVLIYTFLPDIKESLNKSIPLDSTINMNQRKQNERDLIDIHSQMLNMDKHLTKDLIYNSFEKKQNTISPVGELNTVNTRLSTPTCLSRGIGKNRWYNLSINPQDNSIEPFNRIGENTVNHLIDNYSYNC